MGYRSDIRIITSEKGFEELKKFVTKYLKELCNKFVLFGDAIMEGLQHLSDKEYSYRYMRIGEEYDDVEEQYCDGEKDKNIFLEYPSMIREFDDEYVKEQLKENDKIIEIETDKENIDI